MNAHVNKSNLRRRWNLLTILGLAILVLLAGFVVVLSIQQGTAVQIYNDRINELRAANHPVDNATLEKWFAEHSSTKMTDDWTEINSLLTSTDWGDLPVIGSGQLPRELSPSTPWPQASQVCKALEQWRPLINRVQAIAKPEQPVWMPVHFSGSQTLLPSIQDSRNIIRLLALEFEYAVYVRDASRAVKALDAMEGTAAAFKWEFCVVTALIHMSFQGQIHECLNRSMAADVWNESELAGLRERVKNMRQQVVDWNTVLSGERGCALASLNLLPVNLPTSKLEFISSWQLVLRRPNEPIHGLRSRIPEMPESQKDDIHNYLTRLFMPALGAFATSLIRIEQHSEMLYTAIAVKRFQVKHKRWPKHLTEVSESDNSFVIGSHGSDTIDYKEMDGQALVWVPQPAEANAEVETDFTFESKAIDIRRNYYVLIR